MVAAWLFRPTIESQLAQDTWKGPALSHYAELAIRLFRVAPGGYKVELRFADPDPSNQAERAPVVGDAPLDVEELLLAQLNDERYGGILADQLFAADAIREEFAKVKAVAEDRGDGLRIRLIVDPTAAEIQHLRWELLPDPATRNPIATSQNTPFSRFLSSRDWRPARLRPRAELTAVVAVSAPRGGDRYRLDEVDLDGEIDRAVKGLKGIRTRVVGRDQPLTLGRLISTLREGPDILYLVCHGILDKGGEPHLFLQDEAGEVARVEGEEVARRVSELPETPRLVVLASCESAGREGSTGAEKERPAAQAALAPRLAEAGVPAIVAMQGRITMETVEKAMPVFFSELVVDGRIDRAMAVARGAIRERRDAWMPALFLRLKSGRLWYEPGFGESEEVKWRSLGRRIRRGEFIPILGPALPDRVCRTSYHTARQLAETHRFPLAAHEREDLPKVAQYLSVKEGPDAVRHEIEEELHRTILALHGEAIPEASRKAPVGTLMDVVGAIQRDADPYEPHRVLADLPASIYVTANPDNLLEKALIARGDEPERLVCRWRDDPPVAPVMDEEPTDARPAVYHVLGYFGEKDSLVLTEDDYFDYLIATTTHRLVPQVVESTLLGNSLLFLGFRLTDWSFRILFRLIMSLPGRELLKAYPHVAVQVDPEQHALADPEGARRYLESYFVSTGHIDIYWGGVEDFLKQLSDKLEGFEAKAPEIARDEDSGWD